MRENCSAVRTHRNFRAAKKKRSVGGKKNNNESEASMAEKLIGSNKRE